MCANKWADAEGQGQVRGTGLERPIRASPRGSGLFEWPAYLPSSFLLYDIFAMSETLFHCNPLVGNPRCHTFSLARKVPHWLALY